ncbi:MAG: Holliday junction resolvase RecU [Bacilli bacterium]|nr:Holliday junction resolvase RecU [Bacilli bacterium]
MIRYPNGQVYKKEDSKKKKKSSTELSISSANRGMSFESDINVSNEYYKDKDICLITKRPTPINVVKVDYSKGAKITHAYFEEQSTTDYNGVYKGKYIDFEAKNTKNKTSFPLNNITKHQIEHLKRVIAHGGIAFFIIQFELLDKVFILDASYVIHFYERGERKSIPLSCFEESGIEVERSYNPRLKYIDAIDKLYF